MRHWIDPTCVNLVPLCFQCLYRRVTFLERKHDEALTSGFCLASDWRRPQGVEWVRGRIRVYHSGRSDTGHIWASPMRWWGVDSDSWLCSCGCLWQNALEIWNDLTCYEFFLFQLRYCKHSGKVWPFLNCFLYLKLMGRDLFKKLSTT